MMRWSKLRAIVQVVALVPFTGRDAPVVGGVPCELEVVPVRIAQVDRLVGAVVGRLADRPVDLAEPA